jgi:hypothetical protein
MDAEFDSGLATEGGSAPVSTVMSETIPSRST